MLRPTSFIRQIAPAESRKAQTVGINIDAHEPRIVFEGRFPRVARLEQEWFEDVQNPKALTDALRNAEGGPDVFTFWQRLPNIQPEHEHEYWMERDSIAALPITDYSSWWDKQIKGAARNKVRKAKKRGVVIRLTPFDDRLVEGMISIFNETPIRQGRRFSHYGKDFATVRSQFSRFLFREEILGAYVGEELIGFSMLAYAGKYAVLGQILSKIARRDFAPTNALLARAVERCAEKKLPYLAYAYWLENSLGDFKKSNGFRRFDLPRYYVPLTLRGKVALKLGFHHNVRQRLPPGLLGQLLQLRSWYYGRVFAKGLPR